MQITVQGNGTLLSKTVSVFAPGNGSRYKPLNFVFVANSSSTTLSFNDTSPMTPNVDLVLDNVRITLQNAPYITAQPESLNVFEGSTATFSVTAGGQGSLVSVAQKWDEYYWGQLQQLWHSGRAQ